MCIVTYFALVVCGIVLKVGSLERRHRFRMRSRAPGAQVLRPCPA